MRDESDNVSFSEFHLACYEYMLEWTKPVGKAKRNRDAFIAPRGIGKSTTLFLVGPLWAAAHGHVNFFAAFSDSAEQAQEHLSTFKRELGTNKLIRQDYPEVVEPRRGTNTSRTIADNRGQYISQSGFIFMARGIDSSNLGMKVGRTRPEVIILDDIEKGEADYSVYQAQKRLTTIRDDIFPMNHFARVMLVGTTTMSGGIIHNLIRTTELDMENLPESDQHLSWVSEERFRIHYFPGLITDEKGRERSIWPERWSMEFLNEERRKTRSWAKNWMNKPVSADGQYWTPEDITYGSPESEYSHTMVFVDPALTTSKKSDQTGIAVLSIAGEGTDKRIYVREALGLRAGGAELASKVNELVEEYQADIVVVESNAGGELWGDVFSDLPVPMRLTWSSKKKNYRIGRAFTLYEKGRVHHIHKLPALEEQMIAYPDVAHDDVVDAASTGIMLLSGDTGSRRARAKQMSYT